MFTPSIFGESLFDDWMDDFEKEFDKELRPAKNPLYGKPVSYTHLRAHET